VTTNLENLEYSGISVTTDLENLEYSGISTNMEDSGEFCATSGKILTNRIVSVYDHIFA